MKPQTFIFIGRSGCGKGTQADLLIKALKEKDSSIPIQYLETGNKFREFITQENNYTSSLAREITSVGGLQPEFLAVWMWSHVFVENLKGGEHLIIDGTPRKLQEAHVLDSAMDFYKREKPYVIYMDVSRDEAVGRLKGRNREDDTKIDSINKRLDWFETDVMPAIEYYKKNPKYKFLDIVGERPIEVIHKELMEIIFNDNN
ncbi:MAG: nucleoside monophosphate kinase [Candidatus Paceibacterota bacterium]